MLILSAKILFWISLIVIIYPYTAYPLILFLKSLNKKNNFKTYNTNELPFVSIIMAVHNEEKILYSKIQSIFSGNYPKHLYEIIIGSDASTDNTNKIIKEFATIHNNLQYTIFNKRKGKIQIINRLATIAKADILVFTDADIIFTENTLFELVKYFKETKIGLVDSNLQKQETQKEGIALQEKYYINFEVWVKHMEGLIGGVMMGPFGGAYALRKELFVPVPDNFLVDDFYINMKVLQKGFWSVNNLQAFAFDNGSDNIHDEYKRKIRISTGNFQNLSAFFSKSILKKPLLVFSFMSHKVLRWFSPIFFILLTISSVLLFNAACFYCLFTF